MLNKTTARRTILSIPIFLCNEVTRFSRELDFRLPCDISPPTNTDRVSLVLWFMEEEGKPIYR
jgi:hypothetical protein